MDPATIPLVSSLTTQLIKALGPVVSKTFFGNIQGFTLQVDVFRTFEAWRQLLAQVASLSGGTETILKTTSPRDLIQKSILLILQYFNVYFTQHDVESKRKIVRLMSDDEIGLVRNETIENFGQFYSRELMVDIIACAVVSSMQTQKTTARFWLGRITVASQSAYVLNMLRLRLLRHIACCLEMVGRDFHKKPMLVSHHRTLSMFKRSYTWEMYLSEDRSISDIPQTMLAESNGEPLNLLTLSCNCSGAEFKRSNSANDDIEKVNVNECRSYSEMLRRWGGLSIDWRTSLIPLLESARALEKDQTSRYMQVCLDFLHECTLVERDGSIDLKLIKRVESSIEIAGRALGLVMYRRQVLSSSAREAHDVLRSCAFAVMRILSSFIKQDDEWGRCQAHHQLCCGSTYDMPAFLKYLCGKVESKV